METCVGNTNSSPNPTFHSQIGCKFSHVNAAHFSKSNSPASSIGVWSLVDLPAWAGKKNPRTMAMDSRKWMALTTLLKTSQMADKSFTSASAQKTT